MRFAPRSSGVQTATVSIANNDAPRSPYDFVIQGTCSVPADDHGNTTSTATSVSASSTTSGNIQIAGDEDFFRFTLTTTTNVTLRTTGSTDTYGYLLNSAGSTITSNDDYGDLNFRISRTLTAGTYYVCVRGYNSTSTTGTYSLLINR